MFITARQGTPGDCRGSKTVVFLLPKLGRSSALLSITSLFIRRVRGRYACRLRCSFFRGRIVFRGQHDHLLATPEKPTPRFESCSRPWCHLAPSLKALVVVICSTKLLLVLPMTMLGRVPLIDSISQDGHVAIGTAFPSATVSSTAGSAEISVAGILNRWSVNRVAALQQE